MRLETVNVAVSPFGKGLEGAYFRKNTKDLIFYGFQSMSVYLFISYISVAEASFSLKYGGIPGGREAPNRLPS